MITDHSLFKGFNDQEGIMLCGYESGHSKEDQENEKNGTAEPMNEEAECTFATKYLMHGDKAKKWKYDNRIKKWFAEIFNHPLNESEFTDFDKCIVQTNWCNTQGNKIEEDKYIKLRQPEQVENFLNHIKELKPKVIFFLGSAMIEVLQEDAIKPRFMDIMGKETRKLSYPKRDGANFKVGFQSFEKCEIISLPHPSGTRGLSDNDIELFADGIIPVLEDFANSPHLS